ncbi:hypothetical protein C8R47DRAFT_1203920 [Mycena vitilis]|nr:hypothetical protein C8R47DRAFT_1203920 [Mycena vitilis]
MDTIDYDTPALTAMRLPFPDGCDEYLRSFGDATGDYESAYERAQAHSVQLGRTRIAWLWKHALEIGLRAGMGRSVLKKSAEAFMAGREAGMKEGRTGGLRDGKQDGRKAGKIQGLKEGEAVGLQKGQEDGLKEGKRLGFVAGREFGEKQAMKASKTVAPERKFIDTGTDSPVLPNLPPPFPTPKAISPLIGIPHRTTVPSTAPTPALSWANFRIYAPDSKTSLPPSAASPLEIATVTPKPPTVPFDWADDAKSLPIHLPPRDLSALRTASTPLTPFGTLQRRTYRTKKSRQTRCNPATSSTTLRHPHGLGPGRPSTMGPSAVPIMSMLDWDHDTRLFGLSRALRSLGWRYRGVSGVLGHQPSIRSASTVSSKMLLRLMGRDVLMIHSTIVAPACASNPLQRTTFYWNLSCNPATTRAGELGLRGQRPACNCHSFPIGGLLGFVISPSPWHPSCDLIRHLRLGYPGPRALHSDLCFSALQHPMNELHTPPLYPDIYIGYPLLTERLRTIKTAGSWIASSQRGSGSVWQEILCINTQL